MNYTSSNADKSRSSVLHIVHQDQIYAPGNVSLTRLSTNSLNPLRNPPRFKGIKRVFFSLHPFVNVVDQLHADIFMKRKTGWEQCFESSLNDFESHRGGIKFEYHGNFFSR